MNKRAVLIIAFLLISAVFSFLAIKNSSASPEDGTGAAIQYPVKELGDCAGEAACKTYCDAPTHAEACLNFAENHGLLSSQEIETARKFLAAGGGPGGCKTKDACENYCDSASHMDECIAFAEKNDLMSPSELAEAKKIQAAQAREVKAPACGGKKQCETYCSEPAHMEECITFAREAGFMSAEELKDSEKMLAAIKAGAKPPPCRGKQECETYCSQEEHFDACLDFSLAAGFMDPKDAEMARKTKGKGPGGCRGREECDSFCQKDENMETCASFAYENGMMTKEEFEMMKKTGGKGPGGCKSKEQCENFCNVPENQETCMSFAKEKGLIPQEDLQRMEQAKQQFKESMQNIPSEVYSCLESAVGAEAMAKLKSGNVMPPRELGDKMKECFEKSMPKRPEGQENMPPGAPGQGGNMPPGSPPPGGMMGPPPGGGQGSGQMPCEGQNCPPAPPAGSEQFRPPTEPGQPGPSQQPAPCQGGGCPSLQGGGTAPSQSAPPPASGPGAGGGITPGEFVPPIPVESAPPSAPAPQAPPPSGPASPPPPSSFRGSPSLLGSVINVFIEYISGK